MGMPSCKALISTVALVSAMRAFPLPALDDNNSNASASNWFPPYLAAIDSEIIPTSSDLPYSSEYDSLVTFTAPNGRVVSTLVKGPVGKGTYSRRMRADETADSYFPAVVSEATQARVHTLIIPKGTYRFSGDTACFAQLAAKSQIDQYWLCGPHWQIGTYPSSAERLGESIEDLTIDFSGSTLDFNVPGQGISIINSQRIRLENVTIDWPTLPIASLGTIIMDPADPTHTHKALALDAKYPVASEFGGARGPGNQNIVRIEAVDPWHDSADPATAPGWFGKNSNNNSEVYFIFGSARQPALIAGTKVFSCVEACNFANVSPAGGGCSFFNGCANFDAFEEHERVVVRHFTYNGEAIAVTWSNDVQFENVTLLTGPGDGIQTDSNGGFRGFRVHNSRITRGPGRVISIASGSIAISGMQSDVQVDGNLIAYQGDDGLSFSPGISSINSVTPAAAGGGSSVVNFVGNCDINPKDDAVEGDTLFFYDQNYVFLGMAKVAAISTCADTVLTATLDVEYPRFRNAHYFIDVTNQADARYIARNNIFAYNRGHGMITNATYGMIDRNTMSYDSAGGIGVNGQNPGSDNLCISNNTVSYPGEQTDIFGAISVVFTDLTGNILRTPSTQKLLLDNNQVAQTGGPAIVVTSSRYMAISASGVLNSNLVDTPYYPFFGTSPFSDSIIVFGAGEAEVCGSAISGQTSGPIGIDPSADPQVFVAPHCPRSVVGAPNTQASWPAPVRQDGPCTVLRTND
jgi:hypothetical protein